ncbi:hypothetical protein [Phenylobacterium sp.]|uniref:hypothetical protein n=1 Tax=Phenylobacterium sp. TaxID=1871053 RepID=UPI002B5F7C24|nr:hypothetical protein [Phenylobacterium sp.]HVI31022.1 hypothetical protein [Phenylobacterium sp.]
MLTLGELLAASRRSAAALDLAALPEPLGRKLAAAAEREQVAPGDFLRMAVADFADYAGAEDWTHLMSRLRDRQDAGWACLQTMLEWRLAQAGPAPAEEPETEREPS